MLVKKLTKRIAKGLCVLLTAAMAVSNTDMLLFAQEYTEAEEHTQAEEPLTEQVASDVHELQEETEAAFFEEESATTEYGNAKENEENVWEDESKVSTENSSTEESHAMEEEENSDTESSPVQDNQITDESSTQEESNEIKTSGVYENITWSIDEEGRLTVEGNGDFAAKENDSYERAPWYASREYIKTAKINVQGMTDASYMFYDCWNLTNLDVSGFDAETVTNMRGMFYDCDNYLLNLELNSLNTGNVADMAYMFYNCNLASLDVSGFDTKNVTNMRGMFQNCKNLTDLNMSGFNTGSVTDMGWMFSDCRSLENLDVSGFDTKNVTDMQGMFYDCDKAAALDVSGFDTKNVVDMSYLFCGCWCVSNLDVSGFDTGNVESMAYMFSGCQGLTGLDVSGFDTGNVESIAYMFSGCQGLTSLDVSGFDTKNVTDMSYMFTNCSKLTSLDVSGFDTKAVTSMAQMFGRCRRLVSLDVSGFDTGNAKDMSGMFDGCYGLTRLDVSGFDTQNAEDMSRMFDGCSELSVLDVGGFAAGNVKNMSYMFRSCEKLTALNLSGFDLRNITDLSELFGRWDFEYSYPYDESCKALKQLYTPWNIPEGITVSLPKGIWYDTAGNKYTELSSGIPGGILLTKGKKPAAAAERITAAKAKTVYNIGDKVSIGDLTVKYYGRDGSVKILTESDYITNISELDMTSFGDKALKITYDTGKKMLTAEVVLTVEDKTLQITGIGVRDCTYNAAPVSAGTAVAKTQGGKVVTSQVELVYAYTGTQADGSAYALIDAAPVNAGTYCLTVSVAENEMGYTGSATLDFSIAKAPLTITARDMVLKTGEQLPDAKDYRYDTVGLRKGDSLLITPTIVCEGADTSKEGTYEIAVLDADAGMNYEITYKNGTLSVSESGQAASYYVVTFHLSGKGSSMVNTGVKEGSLLKRPKNPQKKGYVFTGWYKDKSCTIMWDFATDTIQSDTTLYAGWVEDKGDLCEANADRIDLDTADCVIKNIKTKVYDGNPYHPSVQVTMQVNGKKITLTEGADYSVFYGNNINAGTGSVIIRGNGSYKGEKTKEFTIGKKPVKKLKTVTGSIFGNIDDMKASALPLYVYDGRMLLKAGTDYTFSKPQHTKKGVQVIVTGMGNYAGTIPVKFALCEMDELLITPENVSLDDFPCYSGTEIKPRVSVYMNGRRIDDDNYKVQYQNNINAGTGFAIVTGKGAYKGTAVVPFTIHSETAELLEVRIKRISDKTYNAKLQKPPVAVSVWDGEKTKKLTRDKDYTVSYQNNFHAGNAVIMITGKGNYEGMREAASFRIHQQDIRKASLKGTQDNLTVICGKRELKEGIDYEKPKYGAVKNNKVEVIIKGKGDFKGELKKSIKVQ